MGRPRSFQLGPRGWADDTGDREVDGSRHARQSVQRGPGPAPSPARLSRSVFDRSHLRDLAVRPSQRSHPRPAIATMSGRGGAERRRNVLVWMHVQRPDQHRCHCRELVREPDRSSKGCDERQAPCYGGHHTARRRVVFFLTRGFAALEPGRPSGRSWPRAKWSVSPHGPLTGWRSDDRDGYPGDLADPGCLRPAQAGTRRADREPPGHCSRDQRPPRGGRPQGERRLPRRARGAGPAGGPHPPAAGAAAHRQGRRRAHRLRHGGARHGPEDPLRG